MRKRRHRKTSYFAHGLSCCRPGHAVTSGIWVKSQLCIPRLHHTSDPLQEDWAENRSIKPQHIQRKTELYRCNIFENWQFSKLWSNRRKSKKNRRLNYRNTHMLLSGLSGHPISLCPANPQPPRVLVPGLPITVPPCQLAGMTMTQAANQAFQVAADVTAAGVEGLLFTWRYEPLRSWKLGAIRNHLLWKKLMSEYNQHMEKAELKTPPDVWTEIHPSQTNPGHFSHKRQSILCLGLS